ncbi:response regulator [Pararhizobium haloflavum]|uniref:response regulator n=1 Tax=Pararhizobium haloflavum TaxID=2037914 RepID=UPI000C182817|nr:response regulator [Pararhizobium haloflavum]
MKSDSVKRSIVIVEDEVLLALDLEMIAEEVGYSVIGQAAKKSEAIATIDKGRPDLCLIDVHLLDGPTGVDVARHAVENTDALVVFVTANRAALPDDLAGAYGVIAKPYTVSGMREALAHLMKIINQEVDRADQTPIELRAAG